MNRFTMMRKTFFSLIGLLIFALTVTAQDKSNKKFSPEKFEQELRQFIMQNAALTQEEAGKFFPVYKEMRKQQQVLFQRQRCLGNLKPSDDEGCMKVVQERDNIEVELRRLQQRYHNQFFDILSPSKVYDVLHAENEFHRHKLKQWGRKK